MPLLGGEQPYGDRRAMHRAVAGYHRLFFERNIPVDFPSARELSVEGLRRYALQEFGPMALTVLTNWGIRKTDDWAQIALAAAEINASAGTTLLTIKQGVPNIVLDGTLVKLDLIMDINAENAESLGF